MTRSLRRRWLALPLAGALVCLGGCYDIEEVIRLNQDLSGTATVAMTVDLEGLVAVMAEFKKKMEGGEGPVTPEELEAAKKEFLLEQEEDKAQQEAEFEAKKKEHEESLPEGVTLEAAEAVAEGLKLRVRMTYGFDHVSKLSEIEMPEEDEPANPGEENPLQRPFEGLVVEEEGDTVRIRLEKVVNPADRSKGEAEGEEEMGGPELPGMDAMLEGALKSLRVAYRIEAPFEVVEHNAPEQKDGALVWELDYERLKALADAGQDAESAFPPPDVTFRR